MQNHIDTTERRFNEKKLKVNSITYLASVNESPID